MVELIRQVDAAEPIEKLENTLKRDPSLAFADAHQLAGLRAARGDQLVPPRHHDASATAPALVALLLATASKDVNMRR